MTRIENAVLLSGEEWEERKREFQAALEVVQAAQCWARERRLPSTAAERWLMDMVQAYDARTTRYDVGAERK